MCLTTILIYVTSLNDITVLVKDIHKSIAILILISIIGVFLIPDRAIHSRDIFSGFWRGMYSHKNYAGGIAAIGFVLALWLMVQTKQKLWYFSTATIFFTFIWFSNSKTALFSIGLVAISSSLFLIGAKVQGYIAFVTLLFLALCGGFAYLAVVYLEPLYGVDFTDRTFIWLVNWEYATERLFFGHGYRAVYVGETGDGISQITATHAPLNGHAHNGYMEILGQLGIIGLAGVIISIIALFSTTAPALRQKDRTKRAYARAAFAAVLFGLMRACFEPDLLSGTRIHWLLLFALLIGLSTETMKTHQMRRR